MKMSLFDGIGDAEIFERGKYMTPGFNGVVEVKKTMAKPTRKSGVAFIVELLIVETNMPDKHPVGSKGSWFQKLIDKDVAFPAIAAWAGACAGYQPNDREGIKRDISPILQDAMKYATDFPESNDFVGTKLRLECTGVKTKNDKDFTRYDFYPMVNGG